MTTKTRPKTETQALFGDLNKPSLIGLSYMLRHPDTWPEGFIWNYGHCEQCAMGLAHALWKVPDTDTETGASIMARTFAMPYEAADAIFMGNGAWVPRRDTSYPEGALWWKRTIPRTTTDLEAVTPEMVADQIDKYLATAE